MKALLGIGLGSYGEGLAPSHADSSVYEGLGRRQCRR